MFFLFSCSENDQQQNTARSAPNANVVSANGELVSAETAILSPPQAKGMWRYKITFMAPEGKIIQKGKPILGFDASQLQQKLAEKQNELQTSIKKLETNRLANDAKSEDLKLKLAEVVMRLEKSDRKWQQSKVLESRYETEILALQYQLAKDDVLKFERTIIKNKEINTAKIASLENDIQRLQSEVNEYQSSIKNMMIMAPKSGIVVYKRQHDGEKSSIGDSVWMGRQLIELPSLDSMMVKAQIMEADAGKIAIGQPVDIILDAASDRIFKGKIISLGSVFHRKSSNQPNIIFDVEIKIDIINKEIMRPGMAARLKIFTQTEPRIYSKFQQEIE